MSFNERVRQVMRDLNLTELQAIRYIRDEEIVRRA